MASGAIFIGPTENVQTQIRYPIGFDAFYVYYRGYEYNTPNNYDGCFVGRNVTTGYVAVADSITSGNLYLATNYQGSGVGVYIGHSSRDTNVQGRFIHNGVHASFGGFGWIAPGGTPAVNISAGANGRFDVLALRPIADPNWLIQFFNTANFQRGQITGVTATSIAYQTTSDRRKKKNIQPMSPMLDKIMAVKPREYDWIEDDVHGYGMIAQEVYDIFPELRTLHSCCYENDGCCKNLDEPTDCKTGLPVYYGLDYGTFTPYIIKAFQEMKNDYDEKLTKMQVQIDFLLSKLA
jgi:hypothetical protein